MHVRKHPCLWFPFNRKHLFALGLCTQVLQTRRNDLLEAIASEQNALARDAKAAQFASPDGVASGLESAVVMVTGHAAVKREMPCRVAALELRVVYGFRKRGFWSIFYRWAVLHVKIPRSPLAFLRRRRFTTKGALGGHQV
jgi:hypothetical protein